MFTSELVVAEASGGDAAAACRRLDALSAIPELPIDDEAQRLAEALIADGGIPDAAQADALHVAVAAIHSIDYLLTWNCRHIDNAALKPVMRSVCAVAGYTCPEICTPMELLAGDTDDV